MHLDPIRKENKNFKNGEICHAFTTSGGFVSGPQDSFGSPCFI